MKGRLRRRLCSGGGLFLGVARREGRERDTHRRGAYGVGRGVRVAVVQARMVGGSPVAPRESVLTCVGPTTRCPRLEARRQQQGAERTGERRVSPSRRRMAWSPRPAPCGAARPGTVAPSSHPGGGAHLSAAPHLAVPTVGWGRRTDGHAVQSARARGAAGQWAACGWAGPRVYSALTARPAR